MKSRIDILKEYIDFEVNLRNCEVQDTTTFQRVENFIDYRNVRTKQAWLAQMTRGQNSHTIATERNNLDRERRECHNRALTGMLGFDLISSKAGLDKLYTGRLLTAQEIEEHTSAKYDERMEMTDWFLSLIDEIDNYHISRDNQEKNKNEFIEKLQKETYDFEREYGVVENLKKDDGDIHFKDERTDKWLNSKPSNDDLSI